jgi:hypothetical protein
MADAKQQSGTEKAIGCSVLLAILLGGGWVLDKCGTSGTAGPVSAEAAPPDKKSMAWVMCQDFVKQQLKSPASADFGSLLHDFQNSNETVTVVPPNRYVCRGWVDSQNSFGAMIRSEFTATVEDRGEKWGIVDGPNIQSR